MHQLIEIEGKRCRNLWRGVIRQALMDIELRNGYSTNKSIASEQQLRQRTATRWIMEKKVEFRFACEMAGVDPDDIRRQAHKIIKAKALNECGIAINES